MNMSKPGAAKPQPRVMECGGKRSATPLWIAGKRRKSGVVAALCHRTPKPLSKLRGLTLYHEVFEREMDRVVKPPDSCLFLFIGG
jgi:hypothetical protein